MAAPRKKPVNGNGSLLRALQDHFDSFSRSRKAIARYLIDHMDEAPVLSAQELAHRTGTTSSTVVRFAQHLGFPGFTAMMKAAWDEHRLALVQAEGEGQLHFPVDDDFSGRAVRTDIFILEKTMQANRVETFLEVVEMVERAGTICLAGLFEAGMVVEYLRYYLTIMGIPVTAVTSNSEEAVASVAEIDEESLLVAIGFGTAHQFVLRLMKVARERGALTVGISENSLSEVAKLADRNLFCFRDTTSFAPSLVGAFSLANALISALYSRHKLRYDTRLARLRSLPLSSDWL